MFRIFKVLKEISLYREYLKVIKKESLDSPEWSRLRLRKDWFGRIYTVFNLPPEVTRSPDFPKYARPSFVFDQIKPINEYLTKSSLLHSSIQSKKPTKSLSWLFILSYSDRSLFYGRLD
jgi:hypothetical protein